MDLELRNALIERVENDQRAVVHFLKKAKEFRKEFQESAIQSDVPWPYCLLEWDPLSAAPQVVRDVIDTTRASTAFLRNAVFRGGWPGRSLVGCAGADAAWMILQHASSAVSTIGALGDHEFRASLPEELYAGAAPMPECATIPHAERLFTATGADFRIGGDKAFYVPSHDFIQVPPQPAFFEQINYFRKSFHELGHNAELRIIPR